MVFGFIGRAVSGTWGFIKRHPIAIGVTVAAGAGLAAGARHLVAQAESLRTELEAHIQAEMARERKCVHVLLRAGVEAR